MKLVFQETHPLKVAPSTHLEDKVQTPSLRLAAGALGLSSKTHRTSWWNEISNPVALVKEPDPGLLARAAAPLKSLLPEDRNTRRIEELISDNKLNGTDLANSILQHTFGHHVRLQSSDPSDAQGLSAYQAATQIVAAAVEEPLVHSALNVLGNGARGTVTLDIRDIDKFLKRMEPSDGAKIHAASEPRYRLELVKYGTVHDIHQGLRYTKPTAIPSELTPKNPLEKLGVVLDHQLHIDAKTIQTQSPLALQTAAYHVTRMAHGPDVAAWVATQFENKFKYGLPVQKGLFPEEHGRAEQKSKNGSTRLVWKK